MNSDAIFILCFLAVLVFGLWAAIYGRERQDCDDLEQRAKVVKGFLMWNHNEWVDYNTLRDYLKLHGFSKVCTPLQLLNHPTLHKVQTERIRDEDGKVTHQFRLTL